MFGAYMAIGGSEGAAVLAKTNTVRQIILNNYVGETTALELSDGAADGMVEAIDDRWSYYMTAEEYEV